MNRIYQGRVVKVQTLKFGAKGVSPSDWTELPNWHPALWQNHELFQDAVNYYTLALAAMATGLRPDSPKGKAALAWREQVRDSWLRARRKAVAFPGPHSRLAKWLDVNPNETDSAKAFDACANALLKNCPAKTDVLAKALLQLLEEADQSDLNQLAVSRLPWLCTPHGKLDATPKNVVQQQETRRLAVIREIHEGAPSQLKAIANRLELGCFVAQPPKERMTGSEARGEAERLFKSASKKSAGLSAIAGRFTKHLNQFNNLKLPCLGRKPTGAYPFAVVFKLFPTPETQEAFKTATRNLRKKADKAKDARVEIAADFIAEARTKSDQPVFDFFTNRALVREQDDENRAVWFEFDLAAFIKAINPAHRYYEDTLTREKAADTLRKKLSDMKARGSEASDEDDGDDESAGGFGFEGDNRIKLLEELVTDTLKYVAETENPDEEAGPIEYTIRERTLRGFEEIKEKWRKLAEKDQATPEKLIDVLNAQQTKQRDDFGSATLYRALTNPKFHPIWRNAGTEKWHALDPLMAWRAYKELCFELRDKERLIRFTPAHPERSPRYFDIPKQGRFGSDHQPGQLAFVCGMALKGPRGLEASKVRITYSAPRLHRDGLRRDGEENLESVPWLQPMMEALGLEETGRQDFANCRVTLQPASPTNIQLAFPIEVDPEKLIAGIGKIEIWNRQFNLHPDGDDFYNASLRWPHEKQPAKPPKLWFEQVNSFRTLAIDLGQRDAGAFARLAASCNGNFESKPSRFIGKTDEKQWRAALERSGMFRLPGEDAWVWREISERDRLNLEDSGKLFDFREELWGERGRPARPWEANETADLMRQLEAVEKDSNGNEKFILLPEGWNKKPAELSFPEQNDKLLVALRRYQSRISRLHRWCWFLKGDDKRQTAARQEIGECEDMRIVSPEQRAAAAKRDPRVAVELEARLRDRLKLAPKLLERVANRVLPLRGRSWHWERHPDASEKNPLHLLTQSGPSRDSKERPVWIRGQRGLSLERIEQIEELRKRCQSLNQTLRRPIGGKPPIRRDESVPDPCPDLLEKLDNLKEQRVNQTAHMILAEALGLRLAPPPKEKKKLRREKDQHGVYEKILDKQKRWIGPVDFIVIEDLSRYRASQGRAPRENSRLMKWCHRAVRDKLKQLCEVFGLPVLETPAAYSSRFCSRSGVPGFRAEEVSAGFIQRGSWAWLAGKKDEEGHPTEEAQRLLDLDGQLTEAQEKLGRNWIDKKKTATCPKRTLLVPWAGGAIFVPVADAAKDAEISPALAQADINAAINLGLRAIADPRLWSIHPRLRTQRDNDNLLTREKRKFGAAGKPLVIQRPAEIKANDTRQANFFADFAGLKTLANELAQGNRELSWLKREWTSAGITNEPANPTLLHSKTFWGTVKAAQWKRIEAINAKRLSDWKKLKPVPD